ncbi:putative quinol monooxygenase [uncultured Sphingomonas sp.]|uniref:putative quinol monooxygenase n=1 Tax=uncultured Sphingomonas sp. TaxID=158754 RepID=UPI0025D6C290|nr:putative quinol monooxygenase [uncultured Sphingomonas sp.]
MLLIVGTVRLPASNMDAARPARQRMVDASRREEGCVEYGYAQDVFDPGLIHVKELWTDQAALDRHFASLHIAEWRAAWPALGIGDRDLRLYDVAEPRGTSPSLSQSCGNSVR